MKTYAQSKPHAMEIGLILLISGILAGIIISPIIGAGLSFTSAGWFFRGHYEFGT